MSRDHKHIIVLLLDHTHSPTLAVSSPFHIDCVFQSEYKGQLKSKGIRVKGGNHSKEHSKTNGGNVLYFISYYPCLVIHTVGEDPKKLEAPSYALERAQNSKLSIYKSVLKLFDLLVHLCQSKGRENRHRGIHAHEH